MSIKNKKIQLKDELDSRITGSDVNKALLAIAFMIVGIFLLTASIFGGALGSDIVQFYAGGGLILITIVDMMKKKGFWPQTRSLIVLALSFVVLQPTIIKVWVDVWPNIPWLS